MYTCLLMTTLKASNRTIVPYGTVPTMLWVAAAQSYVRPSVIQKGFFSYAMASWQVSSQCDRRHSWVTKSVISLNQRDSRRYNGIVLHQTRLAGEIERVAHFLGNNWQCFVGNMTAGYSYTDYADRIQFSSQVLC